jgi:hypothetical protein
VKNINKLAEQNELVEQNGYVKRTTAIEGRFAGLVMEEIDLCTTIPISAWSLRAGDFKPGALYSQRHDIEVGSYQEASYDELMADETLNDYPGHTLSQENPRGFKARLVMPEPERYRWVRAAVSDHRAEVAKRFQEAS